MTIQNILPISLVQSIVFSSSPYIASMHTSAHLCVAEHTHMHINDIHASILRLQL